MKNAIEKHEMAKLSIEENEIKNNHKTIRTQSNKKDPRKASFIDFFKNLFKI